LKKKIILIVNPKAGTLISKTDLISKLEEEARLEGKGEYAVETWQTQYRGHATELAKKAALEEIELCIAVGGDGTMNETACGLVGSETCLGIIPLGSGNGLARHIKLSMEPEVAMKQLILGKTKAMDVGQIDGKYFFLSAGIGFEGTVAKHFSQQKTRGFTQYLKSAAKALLHYKPIRVALKTSAKNTDELIFTLNFSNGSQYGNNAIIAPGASLYDGLLDITRIAPFPFWKGPELAFRLLTNALEDGKYVVRSVENSFEVNLEKETEGHRDGESIILPKSFTVSILAEKLKIREPFD